MGVLPDYFNSLTALNSASRHLAGAAAYGMQFLVKNGDAYISGNSVFERLAINNGMQPGNATSNVISHTLLSAYFAKNFGEDVGLNQSNSGQVRISLRCNMAGGLI